MHLELYLNSLSLFSCAGPELSHSTLSYNYAGLAHSLLSCAAPKVSHSLFYFAGPVLSESLLLHWT